VPKCDTCYLKNKCCYTYSNSKLVTLSHTYVTCFPWTNLKLSHALIKHKDFINYILPSTNHLPNHINLSQLSSSIHISQILILTIPFLYNTSINLLLNKHLSIAWLVWLYLYGVFMLCYFLCYSCAKSYVPIWEKGSILFVKKASDTHIPYPFYLCISILTSCSVHDRCFTQLFYQNA
jgi:hypothetical protein